MPWNPQASRCWPPASLISPKWTLLCVAQVFGLWLRVPADSAHRQSMRTFYAELTFEWLTDLSPAVDAFDKPYRRARSALGRLFSRQVTPAHASPNSPHRRPPVAARLIDGLAILLPTFSPGLYSALPYLAREYSLLATGDRYGPTEAKIRQVPALAGRTVSLPHQSPLASHRLWLDETMSRLGARGES